MGGEGCDFGTLRESVQPRKEIGGGSVTLGRVAVEAGRS